MSRVSEYGLLLPGSSAMSNVIASLPELVSENCCEAACDPQFTLPNAMALVVTVAPPLRPWPASEIGAGSGWRGDRRGIDVHHQRPGLRG